MYNFFNLYDLNYETIQKRYHTKAAQYYRIKLKEFVNFGKSKTDINFDEFLDKPSYEEGRELIYSGGNM